MQRTPPEELSIDRWRTLRAVRLDALRQAPHAFISDFESEKELPRKYWRKNINGSATWIVVEKPRRVLWPRVIGVACLLNDSSPKTQYVESVWVHPRHRRMGILRELLEKTETVAFESGARQLSLWVLDTNMAALDAYRKYGFMDAGKRKPTKKTKVVDSRWVPVMEWRMDKKLRDRAGARVVVEHRANRRPPVEAELPQSPVGAADGAYALS
jgi:ribosomal protein S18 acetylase RimI-like enzyme